MVHPESVDEPAESRAFNAAAVAYFKDRKDIHARRMLRSPFSGVRTEVSAAILLLAGRGQNTMEAIASGRLALPADDRDTAIAFMTALKESTSAQDFLEKCFDKLSMTREAIQPHSCHPLDSHVEANPKLVEGRGGKPLTLREPVAPEPPAPMRSRNSHFSASSHAAYVECKRKWYYRYLCAAVEDKGSSASFYGTAFHAALEELHKEYPHPSDVSVQTLRMKLEGHLNRAFDIYASGFDTRIELELQRRRAIRTAHRYVEWLGTQAARAPFTVIGCELPAQLNLEGYDFIGYIDRLDRDDATGNVTVIDYKTGAISQTANDYREKVRQFKEFQLPFYYWVRTAQGDHVSRLALIPLKDALLEVTPVSLEVVPIATQTTKRDRGTTGLIAIADLERARTRMIEICRELTGGQITHFEVTDDPTACRYCAYANACNERPAPAQEIFGR